MDQLISEECLKPVPSVYPQLHGSELTADLEKNRANDILIFIYGEELQSQYNKEVKEQCHGCRRDHPSQREHLCLHLDDDDWEIEVILKDALAKVDISYVKALCVETANILKVDVTWLLTFFDQLIKGLETQWEQFRRFGVVVAAMRNMWNLNFAEIPDLQELIQAASTARVKVDMLGKRFSHSSSKD